MSLILPVFELFISSSYLSYVFILGVLALFLKGLIRL